MRGQLHTRPWKKTTFKAEAGLGGPLAGGKPSQHRERSACPPLLDDGHRVPCATPGGCGDADFFGTANTYPWALCRSGHVNFRPSTPQAGGAPTTPLTRAQVGGRPGGLGLARDPAKKAASRAGSGGDGNRGFPKPYQPVISGSWVYPLAVLMVKSLAFILTTALTQIKPSALAILWDVFRSFRRVCFTALPLPLRRFN